MFDIIYITWAVHLLSLITSFAWWLYSAIPIYLIYILTKKSLPFLSHMGQNGSETAEPAKSKRQAKLEKRREKFGR
ncbi:hypothetical protein AX774_g4698 [Zancudomyces culisetae]|uniref:Uncharacterized protein n=1 Tax=Zancudomyces culisetae TaxID=1213189 RepID=A0A1R1PLK9_ZANCU|nr:hypothetical protein AX774_g5582 [Zancudomyces culisetae]OMH81845.1 hypothetical protein AX774_g4698 [Zancudomyces culisetae]|eukprot:OMH80980.1 hypothetical protein AX774_g5582 [Zancudomyces culisetae]